MDRTYESNVSANAPAPPNPPVNGYPTDSGTPTVPGAWWFHMLTEELRALVVAAGVTPDGTKTNQVAAAVQDLISAAVANVNAAELQGYTANVGAVANTIALRDGTAGLTASSFNVSSDRRLKKNVRGMTGALQRLALLKGVTFQWKASGDSAAGLIAQDLERAVPEGVRQVDGRLHVDPMAAIGLLVEALKEERAARRALEKRIAKLERRR